MKKKIRKLFNRFNVDIHRMAPGENNEQWLYEHSIGTIIDIGAHVGKFSLPLRDRFPHATIYAFEPLSDAYKKLVANFYGDDYFKAYNVALGNDNKVVQFHRSSRATSSSVLKLADLHKKAFPESADETIEEVEMKRLDDFFNTEDNPLIYDVFIKLDVQGFEYEVLLGGRRTMPKATLLICEVSFEQLYEGQKLFGDVFHLLKEYGFEFKGMLDQIYHPQNGKILQANAIFCKK